jgi:hypothetical protein
MNMISVTDSKPRRTIGFSPQHEGDTKKADSGDYRHQHARQFGNCLTNYRRHTHLGHERRGHPEHDRQGAISRGQNARRVEQFVADNLSDEDGSEGGKENDDQFSFPRVVAF